MKARQPRTNPSGIEAICASANAMRFAVTSPNHKRSDSRSAQLAGVIEGGKNVG
jgi:hypothetical protein